MNKGITIIISEVIADDSKLIIGYILKSDKKIKYLEVLGLGKFLKINAKTFSSGESSSGEYINDYTYIGSETIHTSISKDKKFNVDLNITEVSDIKGKWTLFLVHQKKRC